MKMFSNIDSFFIMVISYFTGMFNKQKINLEIRFDGEATPYGSHGRLVATSPKREIDHKEIDFVFIGLTIPPKITPDIINFIWEEARHQNYIIHHITEYGTTNKCKIDPILHRSNISHEVKLVKSNMNILNIKNKLAYRNIKYINHDDTFEKVPTPIILKEFKTYKNFSEAKGM